MKITQKNTDNLTMVVTLNIGKEDYAQKTKKILNDYRKNAEIKGFRKGMVPMGLVEKMHGRSALLDAVNGTISDGLNKYIEEKKINLIGEPLPFEEEKNKIDWEKDEEFEVSFELAPAPEINLELTSADKIVYYNPVITKDEIAAFRSNLLKQFGTLVNTDIITEDDFIIADLNQGETRIEGTYIALRSIEDKKIKKSFIGKKCGEELTIDVNKAFENETDRAALLKVKKEELAGIEPIYNVIVKEIKRFAEAEVNQEFFDKAFGKDAVKTEEEFSAKIEERIKAEFEQESEYRFMLDAREALIEKAAISLPEDFLKRWLFTANEGKFTMEEIDKDFNLFLKDFRWQLVRQYLTKQQNIKITREDLLNHARKVAAYQFAMYGLNNAPQEQIDTYAESLLKNEKEGRRIVEKVEDDLVINYVRSVITLDDKKISLEKIKELNK